MTDPKTTNYINQVEYWLMSPFKSSKDKDLPYIKQIARILQSLQTDEPGSVEYDLSIQELEMAYKENKFKYEYVQRKQVEEGISKMKSSVLSRILSKQIIPLTSKVVDKVKPTVSEVYSNSVIPAADKTLRFLHKVFVKKLKVEPKEDE